MSTAIYQRLAASERPGSRWLADFVTGCRWGLEMHRRYESERAAGRPLESHPAPDRGGRCMAREAAMTAGVHAARPAGARTAGLALRALSTLARGLGAGLKAVQYGQMVSVLNRLPDRHLKEAGLRRSDIPEHARRAVYGEK